MTTPPYDPNAGQYNPDAPQFGQGAGGYGQPPGGYGQSPSGYGQNPAGYGQAPGDFGQAPGQFGQVPGQFGQAPPGTGPGYGMPMGYQQGRPLSAVARKRGMTQVMIGAGIFVVGLVITIVTYSSASSSGTGGTYIVAYGPMIVGAITVVRGLVAMGRASRLG